MWYALPIGNAYKPPQPPQKYGGFLKLKSKQTQIKTNNFIAVKRQKVRKLYVIFYFGNWCTSNPCNRPRRRSCHLGSYQSYGGYGNDNPGAKSQGMKQLMAGGGVALIGLTLVPLLANLFTT